MQTKKAILLFVAFMLLFTSFSHGQNKTVQIPMDNGKDTSGWYKWKTEEAKQLKLIDLKSAPESMYFRFWTDMHALDIWTSDFVSFKGVLLNFTRRYDEDVMYNDRKLISEQITLDAATAQRVYKLFADNHIFNMPSQEGIPGWSMGNDGETFVVEYVTPSSYSFKEYWTPSYFKDIKEAVVFNKTVDALEAMLGMRNSWDDFVYSLPKGYYTCGDRIVYVTKAKKEMMQRERRKEKERRPIDFNDCSALSVIMNDTLIRNFLISRIGSIEKCVFKKSYRSRELNIVCKSLVFDNRNYQIFDSSEMLVLNSQPEQVVEIGVTALEKRVYHIFLTANGNGAEFEITYSSKGYEISLWGIDPLIVVNKAYKAK